MREAKCAAGRNRLDIHTELEQLILCSGAIGDLLSSAAESPETLESVNSESLLALGRRLHQDAHRARHLAARLYDSSRMPLGADVSAGRKSKANR